MPPEQRSRYRLGHPAGPAAKRIRLANQQELPDHPPGPGWSSQDQVVLDLTSKEEERLWRLSHHVFKLAPYQLLPANTSVDVTGNYAIVDPSNPRGPRLPNTNWAASTCAVFSSLLICPFFQQQIALLQYAILLAMHYRLKDEDRVPPSTQLANATLLTQLCAFTDIQMLESLDEGLLNSSSMDDALAANVFSPFAFLFFIRARAVEWSRDIRIDLVRKDLETVMGAWDKYAAFVNNKAVIDKIANYRSKDRRQRGTLDPKNPPREEILIKKRSWILGSRGLAGAAGVVSESLHKEDPPDPFASSPSPNLASSHTLMPAKFSYGPHQPGPTCYHPPNKPHMCVQKAESHEEDDLSSPEREIIEISDSSSQSEHSEQTDVEFDDDVQISAMQSHTSSRGFGHETSIYDDEAANLPPSQADSDTEDLFPDSIDKILEGSHVIFDAPVVGVCSYGEGNSQGPTPSREDLKSVSWRDMTKAGIVLDARLSVGHLTGSLDMERRPWMGVRYEYQAHALEGEQDEHGNFDPWHQDTWHSAKSIELVFGRSNAKCRITADWKNGIAQKPYHKWKPSTPEDSSTWWTFDPTMAFSKYPFQSS